MLLILPFCSRHGSSKKDTAVKLTTKYLKNLGIEISGLDLSDKIIEQARINYPEIHFRKGNLLELEFENDSISGIVAFYAIVRQLPRFR